MRSSAVLYSAVVLIWGSTWLAIKYQLGVVPPELSVAYRFALAAIILFVGLAARSKLKKRSFKTHGWLVVQGLSLFSINYVLFYFSELNLTSGICSVIFSGIVGMNVINSAICFKKPINRRVVVGALLGFLGICAVFLDEILKVHLSSATVHGLIMSLCATVVASFGNMTAMRNQKHGLSTMEINAYGMAYGSLTMFVFALLRGSPIIFDPSMKYVLSLTYLAVFGSVLAFGFYLTLVKRIGADRASYSAVLFPIVALALSTVYESYHWTLGAILGIALILSGNVLVLRKTR